MAVRYAEWARLIDDKMNVSAFRFDVHGNGEVGKPARRDSNLLDSTRLVKVMPAYAYKNRRMTEKDLYREMESTSKRWEDFRTEKNGDRDEQMIGSLHAEILACHGLVRHRIVSRFLSFATCLTSNHLTYSLSAAKVGHAIENRCCLLFCLWTLCLCI